MCTTNFEEIVMTRVQEDINNGRIKIPENINWETFDESIRRLCWSLPRNTKGGAAKQADLVFRLRVIPWFEGGCKPVSN